MVRVLGVVGSPRKGGNTELLVNEVLKAAASAGAKTETMFLPDYDLAPCDGCQACFKTKNCVITDDWEKLFRRVAEVGTYVAEFSPDNRRAFNTGLSNQMCAHLGTLMGTAVILLLVASIGNAGLASYGWRVAFLLSFALLVSGVYMRAKLVKILHCVLKYLPLCNNHIFRT